MTSGGGWLKLSAMGLARWSGTTTRAAGLLFAVAAFAQLLFTSWFGESRFTQTVSGLALYHSLNVSTYLLISASLACLYLTHRSQTGTVLRTGFAEFFLSAAGIAVLAPGNAMFVWLTFGVPTQVPCSWQRRPLGAWTQVHKLGTPSSVNHN